MKLQRKLTQCAKCAPEKMAKIPPAAIQSALADVKADILAMAKLLREAGYPRCGTAEENQSIREQKALAKVQTLIPIDLKINKENIEMINNHLIKFFSSKGLDTIQITSKSKWDTLSYWEKFKYWAFKRKQMKDLKSILQLNCYFQKYTLS